MSTPIRVVIVEDSPLASELLTSILENRRHSESHDEQVQRCFANHYYASWIDLPISAANRD